MKRVTAIMRMLLLMTPLIVMAASTASAAIYRFDFGRDASKVEAGFTKITPATLFGSTNPAGWATASSNRTASDLPYEVYVERNGKMVPPPIWTSPLSQDSIESAGTDEFVAKVLPGTYRAWIFCGTSVQYAHQVFDFDVVAGGQSSRVLIAGGYQFRDVFLLVDASAGEVRLKLNPRSRWLVAGIVLWTAGEESKVQQEIAAERQFVDFMPPAEAKKWQLETRPPDPTPWPAIAGEESKRGYLVHHRHWADVVYPDTVPIAAEINPTLRAFASPGEYEPLNFVVYPLKRFEGATVTASDLASDGGMIPAANIEIRRVKFMRTRPAISMLNRYRIVPDVLMPQDPKLPLPEKENTRYWLTVHVPAETPPGLYKGTATFAPEGSSSATIPVLLRVLPIALQEDPGKIYGIYGGGNPFNRWRNAKDDVSRAYYLQKAGWMMEDMARHGIRNTVMNHYPSQNPDGTFKVDFELLGMMVDYWHRYDFKPPIIMLFSVGALYKKHMGVVLDSHAANAVAPSAAFLNDVTLLVQTFEKGRVQRNWPEFIYYPYDEPAENPGTIAFMEATLRAVKAAGVRTYLTAPAHTPAFEPLEPFVDVWSTQPFLPSREEALADMAARSVEYWSYPNHVSSENDHTPINGARMTFGFGFWRSGFTGLIPWSYSENDGNPWNYLDGYMSDTMNRVEDNGRPIPVALWEGYREGYDDDRYVFTLQQTIEKAKGQDGLAEAAREAQDVLDDVWNRIRVQAKYVQEGLWAPREFDVYRWMIAEQILKLQEAGTKTTEAPLEEGTGTTPASVPEPVGGCSLIIPELIPIR